MPAVVPVRDSVSPADPTPPALLDSLARLGRTLDYFEIVFGLPADGDWIRCADLLAEPAGFDRWRKRLGEWLDGEYGHAPERTTAGYVLSWYLDAPAHLAALLFHLERRVPSLRPADLAFRLAESRQHPIGIALSAEEFVCLPDDPAAGRPEATVVRDERALAAVLRGRFAAHAAAFIDAYRPTVRLGRHTLWAAATDALDTRLWLAGKQAGDESAGIADATLVLSGGVAPFTSGSTLRTVIDEDGRPAWTRRRESCCFHYLLGPGAGECATCPRALPKR